MSQLRDRVRREMVRAISEHGLLEAGDKVMVAVSGGKDSAALLSLLSEVQKKAPFPFTVTPVILDQKQPDFQLLKKRLIKRYEITLYAMLLIVFL